MIWLITGITAICAFCAGLWLGLNLALAKSAGTYDEEEI